jgi:hypothetical protein
MASIRCAFFSCAWPKPRHDTAVLKNTCNLDPQVSSVYMEEVWCLFPNMATAFRRLQTTSKVYLLVLEGERKKN